MAFDLEIGTMTVYCEASGQSAQAKLAVAWSILNRISHGGFGNSVAEVCLRRMQYSEWNADAGDNANLLRAAKCQDDDGELATCKQALQNALAGESADPTDGATHYYSTNISPPYWTKGAKQTVQIGPFVFFKEVP